MNFEYLEELDEKYLDDIANQKSSKKKHSRKKKNKNETEISRHKKETL